MTSHIAVAKLLRTLEIREGLGASLPSRDGTPVPRSESNDCGYSFLKIQVATAFAGNSSDFSDG